MKKILFASLLSLALTFSFIGCSTNGQSDNNPSSNGTTTRSVDQNNENLKDDIKSGANDIKDDMTNTMDDIMGNSDNKQGN